MYNLYFAVNLNPQVSFMFIKKTKTQKVKKKQNVQETEDISSFTFSHSLHFN